MKKTTAFALLITTLLLIQIGRSVYAQLAEDEYDYYDPSSYSSSEFYQNSNPEEWNWEYVNVAVALEQRPELLSEASVYSRPEFYDQLPADYYSKVDYTLVDYNQVNHDKVDGNKYLADLRCNGCIYSKDEYLFEEHKVKFSENGIDYGSSHVSIPGNYPSGTLIVPSTVANRIRVYVPSSVPYLDLPSSENVQVMLQQETYINGHFFEGYPLFNNGQLFVPPPQTALNQDNVVTIDGVTIENLDYNTYTPLAVYEDGERHKDSRYVSLNVEEKKFIASNQYQDKAFSISFTKQEEEVPSFFDLYTTPFSDSSEATETSLSFRMYKSTLQYQYNGEETYPTFTVIADEAPQQQYGIRIFNGASSNLGLTYSDTPNELYSERAFFSPNQNEIYIERTFFSPTYARESDTAGIPFFLEFQDHEGNNLLDAGVTGPDGSTISDSALFMTDENSFYYIPDPESIQYVIDDDVETISHVYYTTD